MKYLYTTFILALLPYLANSQNFEEELGTPVEGVEIIQLEELSSTSEVEQQAEVLNDFIPVPDTESEFNGATKGNFSVSLTGGATYSLPIAVPPGINGVEPQIAITYNSQAGNGLAGYGWNIAGLSSISRVGSNKYYDDKTTTVKFDSDDRFILDGQRLILKSGIYGADGSEYELENKSNVRVFAYGSNQHNNGPYYFKVLYADGSKAYYGLSYNDGFFYAGHIAKTETEYYLNYIENAQDDVTILYVFKQDGNGGAYINEIRYGFHSGQSLGGNIKFVYKDRTRIEEGYSGGKRNAINKTLDKVEIYGLGQKTRTYQLTHGTTSLGYERLTKIEEIGSDGLTKKEPVTFSYGVDPTGTNFFEESDYQIETTGGAAMWNLNSKNTAAISGDYSANGRLGFLLYHFSTNQNDINKYIVDGSRISIYNPSTDEIIAQNFSTPFHSVVASKVPNYQNILLNRQAWTVVTNTTKLNNAINTYSFKTGLAP